MYFLDDNFLQYHSFFSISVHPLINVYEELIITRLGSTVTLQCTIEASPKAVHFWVKKGTEPGHEGDYLQWLKSKQSYSKLRKFQSLPISMTKIDFSSFWNSEKISPKKFISKCLIFRNINQQSKRQIQIDWRAWIPVFL